MSAFAEYSRLDVAAPEHAHLPPLPRDFYLQDTLTVARTLLNCLLIHDGPEGRLIGRISETEAYTQDDPACHAFTRKTDRNAAMFGPPGHAYMHMNYGVYYCFNTVTAPEHAAEAALVRALEPLVGWERMRHSRGLTEGTGAATAHCRQAASNVESDVQAAGIARQQREQNGEHGVLSAADTARVRSHIREAVFLCGGPGKLCLAFGLNGVFNHRDLTTRRGLWIAPPVEGIGEAPPDQTVATTRIGITKAADYPWRFYLRGDPYISKK